MHENICHKVEIWVNIKWYDDAYRYVWTYSGQGVNRYTGNFRLPGPGRTAIIYQLDADCTRDYQLIYVNLDPVLCATYQIESLEVDREKNLITLINRNLPGYTNVCPFSLRLVARKLNNIYSGFISPDPQITNMPNSMPPYPNPTSE